jgi:hypothetical protein
MALTKVHDRMINNRVANVLDFGAVADGGSGSPTDNVTAFKAAIASGAQKIYVPAGHYYLSDGFALGYQQGIEGDGFRDGTKLRFADTLASTAYGIFIGDGGYVEKLRIVKTTNTTRTGKGIDADTAGGGSKWVRIKDVFCQYWEDGIHLRNYYHTVENAILHNCDYGLYIGNGVNATGSVTVTGCHFKYNDEAGVYLTGVTNNNNFYGCTWEFNNVHMVCNGSAGVWGGYMADTPVSGITGIGTVYVNLAGTDDIFIGDASNGADYGLDLVNTDYCYAVRVNRATIENARLGCNEQLRSTPSPNTILRGSVLGQGYYTLNNVRFASSATNDALYVLEASTTIDQQILSNGIAIPNYINNGLFFDETKAADVLYIDGTHGVSSTGKNPWGGGVVLLGRYSPNIRWTVPANMVGKEHVLMIYSGVVEAGSLTSGPGLDFGNSTNMTFDFTISDMTQIGSEYTTGVRALTQGKSQSGRTTIGLTGCVVVPTSTTGVLHFAMNGDAALRFQIHGMVMTPRNPINSTGSEGFPIGWFDTADPAAL